MTGKIAVGGITRKDGLVLVRVLGAKPGQGLTGRTLSGLGLQGVNIVCVTSFWDDAGLNNISVAVDKRDLDQTLGILQDISEELQARAIKYQKGCSAVSIYGPHFSEQPSIAGTIFDATARVGVDILMISTSFSTVSFVTNEDQADAAVAELHESFRVP